MRNRNLFSVSICVCLCVSLCSKARAESATTQPVATQPSDVFAADSPIRNSFKQLADPDPKIREQARIDLMGMSADDLPRFRQLVSDSQPLTPTQSAALHDIVVQTFLSGDPYDSNSNAPTGRFFVGISWPPDNNAYVSRMGVPVGDRLPGFPSFRFLHPGDMILAVYLDSTVPTDQSPKVETHNVNQLSAAIGGATHQEVVLQILRDGQAMDIPLKMAPRPVDSDGNVIVSIVGFMAPRIERADAYWQRSFAPLLEPNLDSSELAQ